MINIIICDDNKEITNILKKYINQIIFNYKIEYKIYVFNDYSDSFYKIIDSKIENKFYILDIDVNNKSGIDISKRIRNNDWDSAIVLLTAHYELEYLANHSKILLLDFISKFDTYEEKIKEALDLYVNKIIKDDKLSFKQSGSIFNIEYDSILYIHYDKYKRKSIVVTKDNEYILNISLKSIKEKLKGNFCYSHKSCIVNKSHIKEINNTKKEITFSNNKTIQFLSKKYGAEE